MAYNTRQGSGGPQSRARRSNQPIAQNFISGGQLTGPLNQLRPPYTIPSLFEVNGNRFRGAPVQRMNMMSQQQIQQQPLLQLQQPPLQQQQPPLQQQQPPLQQQQQQQPPPQQQQQQPPPPQQQQQQQQPPPQQQQQLQPAPQQQQQQQQFQATFLQQQSNVPNINQSSSSLSSQIMIQGEIKEESSDAMVADNTIEQNKEKRPLPFKTGKISKKERQRRRNNRLSRILQPKNAVMILNELVKNISYNLTELPQPNQYQFMASVQVADENHVGYGHSKMEAKSSAAEAALKSIVKNRNFNQLTQTNKDVDGDEKMEANDATLPWQHIASFALFKLLNEWGEAPFQANLNPNNNNNTVMDQSDSQDNSMNEVTSVPPQNRPAKRMPDNAIHINPLMLLNQMLPHAQFEELGRSGDPPNISFTFKCTVDGESFIGSGSNKKSAKKVVAFQVCHKILSVQYPPEIYTPNA